MYIKLDLLRYIQVKDHNSNVRFLYNLIQECIINIFFKE